MNASKLRCFFLLILSVKTLSGLTAQSGTLSAGGDASSGAGSFSFSIGQLAYESLENTTYKVYQGIQQPYMASSTNQINYVGYHSSLKIYPNPASDVVFIHNAQTWQHMNYRITDIGGKMLLSGSLGNDKTTVDIRNLSPGVYFIFVENNLIKQETYTLIKK